MAEIAPFKGILYDRDKAGDLLKVLAPPYDVISEEEREGYYKSSESNIVRVILGKDSPDDDEGNNRYRRAEDFLLKWMDEGVLRRDEKPAVYLLEQEYLLPDGSKNVRKGFISLVKLKDYEYVRPHEATLSGPKEDRLKLFKECRSNFSPIFTFYSDDSKSANEVIAGKEESEPDILLDSFKGVRESLWRITEDGLLGKLSGIMKDKIFYIADGHHRYATALNYQKEMKGANPNHKGDEPYNYTMVYYTNMADKGLTIFPTHRMVRKLAGFNRDAFRKELDSYFEIVPCKGRDDMLGLLSDSGDNRQMGLCLEEDDFSILKLKDKDVLGGIVSGRSKAYHRLNVAVLHELVMKRILDVPEDTFENIVYSKDAGEVVNKVAEGLIQIGFIMQPIDITALRDVVEAGELMPRKATYFYPKLLSGMVINRIK